MAEKDWLPPSWGGLRAMFEAIFIHIAGFATPLDLKAADVTAIQNFSQEAMDVIDYYDQAKAVAKGLGEWRDDAFTTGPKGGALPDPTYPGAFTTVALPVTGIIPTLREWRAKWIVASGWTEAIGDTLKVGTPTGDALDPSTVKPELDCHTAMSGNFDFAAVIGNRGDSDQCELSAAEVGSASYKPLITFVGKGVTGHWPDGTDKPVQIQVRAQLKRKNANYGIPSDPFVLTVIP